MKILQINKYLYPKGGAETYALALIELLSKNGQEIACFSQKNSKNVACDQAGYFIDNLDLSKYSLHTILRLPRLFWSLKARRLVKKLIAENRPDIVHIHNIYHQISPSILPLFKEAGIPVVMTVHDFKLIVPNYTLRADGSRPPHKNSYLIDALLKLEFAWHKWLKIYQTQIDLYIAPSEFVKDKLIENGFAGDKIKVVPHFLSKDFKKAKTAKYKKSKTEKYLFASGRLDDGKGFADLIRVFAELNIAGLKLKIAGEGPDKDQLAKLIKDLGLKKQIELIGQKNRAQIIELIANSKIVVNCSRLHETFGLTVLEAMALGKPIVASKVGAIPELITHEKNGLLYQVSDAGDLKKQLLKLINDEKLRDRLAREAKLTAKNYSEKIHFKAMMNIYCEAIKNHKKPIRWVSEGLINLSAFIMFTFLFIIPFYQIGIENISAIIYPPKISLDASYPRLANLYWRNPITPDVAKELAKWDLLVLDMTAQYYSADAIKEIRKINPQIIILAYTTATEMPIGRLDAVEPGGAGLWHDLASEDDNKWHLKNYQGKEIVFWPGNVMMNLGLKNSDGQTYSDYLINFYNDKILSSGLWDGLFFDTAWKNISWLDKNIDIDGDGKKDSENKINAGWQNYNSAFYAGLRKKIGSSYLIIANGDGDYGAYANGRMLESFPEIWEGGWIGSMKNYQINAGIGYKPRFNIINSDSDNTGKQNDFRAMRYGLTSALLFDGYYSFDYGTNLREQLWWYDEYDADLGQPIGPAKNFITGSKIISEGIWQREFENGIVLVNSIPKAKTIKLDEFYRKLNGSQDQQVNDGSRVQVVTIPANDGLILLRAE